MKIVWLSHGSSLEGAERCLIEAATSLASKGVEIHLIVPSPGEMIPMLENIVASITVIPHPRWIKEFKDSRFPPKRLYQFSKATAQIIKFLKQVKPDLVITNTIVSPCAAMAAKFLKIPHIWYIHEFLEEDHGWNFEFGRNLSLRIVSNLSQQIIVVSQAVLERFRDEIPASKMTVVYGAVEKYNQLSEFCEVKKADNIFHIALIGRKSPSKGQQDAVRALSILRRKNLNLHLWLVGSDFFGYTKKLEELAESLGISSDVSFIPFVRNPLVYTLSADAILACSKSEAFGRIIIEAMKLEKPIIASDTGSTPELIQDNWNGLIYRFGSAESLAEKIAELYNDKTKKSQIAANAFGWANKNFNSERYSTELFNIFEKVIAENKV